MGCEIKDSLDRVVVVRLMVRGRGENVVVGVYWVENWF